MHIFALRLVKKIFMTQIFSQPHHCQVCPKAKFGLWEHKTPPHSLYYRKHLVFQPCKISMQTKQKKVSLNWTVDLLLKLILISSPQKLSPNSDLLKLQRYSPAAQIITFPTGWRADALLDRGTLSFAIISAKWSLSAGHVFSMKRQVQQAISHFLFSSFFLR